MAARPPIWARDVAVDVVIETTYASEAAKSALFHACTRDPYDRAVRLAEVWADLDAETRAEIVRALKVDNGNAGR